MADLLKLRNAMKRKKPVFRRQYSNVMKQLSDKWNRPRGMHSKMRMGIRGKKLLPAVGFRSPTETRGLTRSGLVVLVVSNVEDLKKVDPKKHGVFFAAGLGMRKRVEIAKKAIEMKITLENAKDAQKFIDESKKIIEGRKKESSERKNKKVAKKNESTKAKEKEQKKEEKTEKRTEENKSEVKTEAKPAETKKTENVGAKQ